MEFLRREVADLELVISSLRQDRKGEANAAHQVQGQLATAIAGLEATEAEAAMLRLHGRLLRSELLEAEAAREASGEAEAYALSVARSYRSFAAQGAQKHSVRGHMHT